MNKKKITILLRKFGNETMEGGYSEEDIKELEQELFKAIIEDKRWPKKKRIMQACGKEYVAGRNSGVRTSKSALKEILGVKE